VAGDGVESRAVLSPVKSLIGTLSIILGIENESSGGISSDDPLVLPDIKDMLKKKEIEQEKERLEEEKKQSVKKIKRSDKEAFRKVCLMILRSEMFLLL